MRTLTYAGIFCAMAVGLASLAVAGTESTVPALDKKLIEYGWDVPFPDFIRANIRTMERRPFDGLIFKLHGGGTVLQPKPFDEAKFEQDYRDLPRIRWRRFTDNFVIMWAASDQDWFNDEHWRAIEHNVRLVTKGARLAGCVGICFDPEPYGTNPWFYPEAAHHATKTFADYEAVARRRGAQFVHALRSELPKAHILTLFQLSLLASYMTPMDPAERAAKLSQQHYGLLPAFLNGMLDAAGEDVTITDGNESAYYYTDSRQHFEVYHRIVQRALTLIDPRLWERYDRQVLAGQALYIDQYFGLRQNTKTYGNFLDPEDQARWFEHNVYWSMYTTDKYVWCYSERMNWWTDQGVPPGCEEAIRSARAKLDAGLPLGFDLKPIIEGAQQRQQAQLEQRLKKRSAEIQHLPTGVAPPKIDGSLDDAAWQQVKPLEPFVLLASQESDQWAATEARVTWDDVHLYVGFRCTEPAVDKMNVVGVKHDDDLWQGDDVEVMISQPGKTAPFYHFMLNPRGVKWDSINSGEADDRTYNPNWQGAAQVGKDWWSAEMALPWAEMRMTAPKPGDQLRANLCRQRTPVRELSAWSPMVSGFLEHQFFGTWVFR